MQARQSEVSSSYVNLMLNVQNIFKMSKNDIHKRGKQFCLHCDKETMHTPKLGLVMQGKRLCEECSRSNDFKTEE